MAFNTAKLDPVLERSPEISTLVSRTANMSVF